MTQSKYVNLVLSRDLGFFFTYLSCKFLDHLLRNRGVTKSIKFVSPERMSIKDVKKMLRNIGIE